MARLHTLVPATKYKSLTRRRFMAGAGAAASFTIIKPELVRGVAANSRVNLGMIGCGERGTFVGKLFKLHGGFELLAAHDYFQDRVDVFGDSFVVPQANRHTGLQGYRQLLEKVDAVAVESPPYFHPEQAADAVDAGKHVYVAKPVAVDVPGCRSISESGAKASAKKLVLLVDFQTRADAFYVEALRRLHQEKAIGEIGLGEASYHAGCPFGRMYDLWRSGPENPENRLRAWGLDRVLSGDIITEQNIHALDVMSWIMNVPPLSAAGAGARKFRPVGTCYDTFSILYRYPNDVGMTFSSRQSNGHDTKPDGIRNRVFGADGVLETQYGGQVMIRGKNFYRGGSSPSIYQEGVVANIQAFHNRITAGKADNPTVEPSVRSNLVAILGRTAAYENRMVTWDELLKSGKKLDGNLKGLA
jgi:myo-inositol 2-dehydrogenase/D-chiro-inositol 1-dehydrogenase